MIKYLTKRLSYGLGVLVAATLLVLSIIINTGISPTMATFGQMMNEETVAAKRAEFGLDKPFYVQIGLYLHDISPLSYYKIAYIEKNNMPHLKLLNTGNRAWVMKPPYLRTSFQSNRPVTSILLEKIPKTTALALAAILLGVLVGVPLGIFAAVKQGTWIDSVAVSLSVVGYSLPSYVMATIFVLVFAYSLGEWTGLPITGGLMALDEYGERYIAWKNLLIPAFALGIRPIGVIAQLTRSAMLDVLSQDFITTAKAKGLSPWLVIVKHAVSNALNPVITVTTGWFASLLAGAIFVESVCGYDGVGRELITALDKNDIPIVVGVVLFLAAVFVVINIIADVINAALDPRIRLG